MVLKIEFNALGVSQQELGQIWKRRLYIPVSFRSNVVVVILLIACHSVHRFDVMVVIMIMIMMIMVIMIMMIEQELRSEFKGQPQGCQ